MYDDSPSPDPDPRPEPAELVRRDLGRAMYADQFGVEPESAEQLLSALIGPRMADEAILAAGGDAWNDDHLSMRERSLIVIACLLTQGGVEPRLRGHMRWALRRGIPSAALETAVLLLCNYAGQPRASVAMEILRSEVADPSLGPADTDAADISVRTDSPHDE